MNNIDKKWLEEKCRENYIDPRPGDIESFLERVAIIWADSKNEETARQQAFYQVFKIDD
jgi:hypothetical protein